MAGEGEEDVVERRSSQRDVVDADPRLVEVAHDLDEGASAGTRRRRQSARVLIGGDVARAVAREDLLRSRDGIAVVDDDLDPLPADLRFQLVRGPAGDDLAVVDDDDPVGQLVRLLEVLGRQEEGDALADEPLG